jgi:hypothetical protein
MDHFSQKKIKSNNHFTNLAILRYLVLSTITKVSKVGKFRCIPLCNFLRQPKAQNKHALMQQLVEVGAELHGLPLSMPRLKNRSIDTDSLCSFISPSHPATIPLGVFSPLTRTKVVVGGDAVWMRLRRGADFSSVDNRLISCLSVALVTFGCRLPDPIVRIWCGFCYVFFVALLQCRERCRMWGRWS